MSCNTSGSCARATCTRPPSHSKNIIDEQFHRGLLRLAFRARPRPPRSALLHPPPLCVDCPSLAIGQPANGRCHGAVACRRCRQSLERMEGMREGCAAAGRGLQGAEWVGCDAYGAVEDITRRASRTTQKTRAPVPASVAHPDDFVGVYALRSASGEILRGGIGRCRRPRRCRWWSI
ncbi:hypothetical protein FA95DRAFT_1554878 [Auriscalpium vulgare]|uniref:Uncharacterized protein n=1 Tax=Auriscalpium vulgare TaxID=40419 RepID=A0ACB8S3J8_9AGAM|nr:hypothetical protein FA95DRAFT_1554878 [Auriscalpium vulgare]